MHEYISRKYMNVPKFYKRLILNIDEGFHHILKQRALDMNMSLSAYVRRSLRQQMDLEGVRIRVGIESHISKR